MKLTEDLVNHLLATKHEFQFLNLIFKNKIKEEEWRKNDIILEHYNKVHKITSEALGKFNSKIADDIPGFCRPNRKKKEQNN